MQATAKREPIKTDPAADEARRLERRRNMKLSIAKLRVLADRAIVLDKQCAEYDQRIECLAASHVEFCEPLQRELDALEGKMTAAIVDRKPVNDKLEARRCEILTEISTSNEALQSELLKIRKLRDRTAEESGKLKSESKHLIPLQNELTRAPLANVDLLNRVHSTKCELYYCEPRVKKAQEQVERIAANDELLADGCSPEEEERHRLDSSRWKYELSAANAAQARLTSRINELYNELLDE